MPRKAVGVDEQATRLVCNEYPGITAYHAGESGSTF